MVGEVVGVGKRVGQLRKWWDQVMDDWGADRRGER